MKKYLLLIFVSILLIGCGKATIIGEWSRNNGDYKYKFNEDKTCIYRTFGKDNECTYEYNEEKGTISIKYKGNNAAFETTYKLEDDNLIIKGSDGKEVIYQRVK